MGDRKRRRKAGRRPLMDRAELAEWLRVSDRTVSRLLAREDLGFPVLSIGGQLRFDEEDVKAWLRMRGEQRDASWQLRLEGRGRELSDLPDYLKAVAASAPHAYYGLVERVDAMIGQLGEDRGVEMRRYMLPGKRSLMYGVGIPSRGKSTTNFAAIDAIAERPRKGMRVRVLHPGEHGSPWAPPESWLAAASGRWMMTSIKPRDNLNEVRARIGDSLDYVLRKVGPEER